MDEAALDHRVRPAGFNRSKGALSTVEDDTEWFSDFAK